MKNNKEKEVCIVCGKLTEYYTDTPVSERIGYIEGGGQLCSACFAELYGNDRSKIKIAEN